MIKAEDEGYAKAVEEEKCICAEYDGEGKSTCGWDCPIHKEDK